MSDFRSSIEALQAEGLAELPDARIEEDFAELHRAVEQLEVERLRRLAEIERRRLFERDGHLSAAAWLAHTFKVAWGTAREHLRIARGLEEMPLTRVALGAVLDAESRSRREDDDRTPAQRRADALGEICRQWRTGPTDRSWPGNDRT